MLLRRSAMALIRRGLAIGVAALAGAILIGSTQSAALRRKTQSPRTVSVVITKKVVQPVAVTPPKPSTTTRRVRARVPRRTPLPARGITGRPIRVVATAYCPCRKCCGSSASGHTATGRHATQGVVAVDPRVIPLGTRVYVEGYGNAIAADTGSAIKGRRIDVCFDSHRKALQWGRRRTIVYVR